MNYKEYFKINNLTNMYSFFEYCQSIKYGWMDKNHNFHNGINDGKTYCLQEPIELMNSMIGICWDMTELERCFFDNMTDLKYETYYIFYEDNKGCPSHSILAFYKNDKVFWFEPMFNNNDLNYSSIHEYNNIKELLKDAKKIFLEYNLLVKNIPEDYDESKIFIYRYNKPKFHINGFEMREHINNSEKIA